MMMCNPTIQKKAQAEVDSVIGSDRLPEFSDLDKLPYLTYLRQEVYRYLFPPLPSPISSTFFGRLTNTASHPSTPSESLTSTSQKTSTTGCSFPKAQSYTRTSTPCIVIRNFTPTL